MAANIELQDSPVGDKKQILVNIDTKGEKTKSIKVALEVSEGVSISNIEEGDGFCSTFSSSPNGLLVEIICTMTQDTILDGTLAKIEFSTTSDEYTFTVLEEQSQIGGLSISETVNVGSKNEANNDDTPTDTGEEDLVKTDDTEGETPIPISNTGKETTGKTEESSNLKKTLAYVLLGVAGVSLVGIIVFSITKKKDDVVLADVPASTTIVNAEAKAATEPLQDQVGESPAKKTLDEIIKPVDVTPPSETTTQENTISENSDLQELLDREKSDTETNTSIAEGNSTLSAGLTSDIADNYQANITEDTLPNIGSTSPIDGNGNLDTNVAPQVETGPQPEIIPQVENTVEQTDQIFDLGNTQEPIQTPPLVTDVQEVANIPPIDTGAFSQPEIVPQVPIENTDQQANQAVDLGYTQEPVQTPPPVTDFQEVGNMSPVDTGAFPQAETVPQNPNQQTDQIFDLGNTQEPIQAPQIGNVPPGDTSAFSQAETLLTDNLDNSGNIPPIQQPTQDNLNTPPTPPTPVM
ncbi:TPA: hypothetical protein GX533_03440 [Candidatus Dojkabacteria bacterium]|uniref:Uncharacterized protein n=1 Tax=Candidatus Dojkabacteria bacterium TaxID=2099670 RepID=A0A832QFT0_9BACT|nr:hypothetical protein [Candidatus Dojkabacteria bacterium]